MIIFSELVDYHKRFKNLGTKKFNNENEPI